MKIQQEQLLEGLKKDVEILMQCVETLQEEIDAFLIPPTLGKWSIAQILEHLNSYGRYYLPAISEAISMSDSKREAWFNSGFWGNYFTNMLKPKNVFEIKNKMRSSKNHSPSAQLDPKKVINEFMDQQKKLLLLLELAKTKNLNEVKVPLSISKLLKLNLGDTFRVIIGHAQRHLIQARNNLKTIGLATDKFPVILREVSQ